MIDDSRLAPNEARWAKWAAEPPTNRRALRDALRTSSGVPPLLRARVWMNLSGAASEVEEGVYGHLISLDERKPGEHSQIELDIHRSGISASCDQHLQGPLRRVLRAYSKFSPSTGYVQGQNFIAAGLLRVLPEEEAFWLLAVIVELYLPDHFTELMTGSIVDCMVLAEMLRKKMPDVALKLEQLEVSVQLISTRWFLCLWSSVLPPPTLLRVYDALFALGPHSTLIVALACFHILRPHILSAKSAEDLALSNVLGPLKDAPPDELVRAMLVHTAEIRPVTLERMRQRCRTSVLQPQAPPRLRTLSLGLFLPQDWRKGFSRARSSSYSAASSGSVASAPPLSIAEESHSTSAWSDAHSTGVDPFCAESEPSRSHAAHPTVPARKPLGGLSLNAKAPNAAPDSESKPSPMRKRATSMPTAKTDFSTASDLTDVSAGHDSTHAPASDPVPASLFAPASAPASAAFAANPSQSSSQTLLKPSALIRSSTRTPLPLLLPLQEDSTDGTLSAEMNGLAASNQTQAPVPSAQVAGAPVPSSDGVSPGALSRGPEQASPSASSASSQPAQRPPSRRPRAQRARSVQTQARTRIRISHRSQHLPEAVPGECHVATPERHCATPNPGHRSLWSSP